MMVPDVSGYVIVSEFRNIATAEAARFCAAAGFVHPLELRKWGIPVGWLLYS